MLPDIFVCASKEAPTFTKSIPAPLFRKSFIAKSTKKASLTIGCTGFYDLFLNGERITSGYLMPYICNPDDVIFYNEYDLSDKLVLGENVICILLGNGHANPIGGEVWGHSARNHSSPAFALDFTCDDVHFASDDMLWNNSHILFNDYRCGVYSDMTLFSKEWYLAGYDDSSWNKPVACDYSHSEKRIARCESVDEIRRIKPTAFYAGGIREYRMRDALRDKFFSGETILGKTPTSGGYIYDFGENCAGVPCLKIKGTRGQKIEMQFCETLYEGLADNTNMNVFPEGACQKDVYICSGDGIEEFIPPFTFHGFRYCYIYGITAEQATEDLLTYVVLHNNVKKKSSFSCSDEISNQIFNACIRSDLANFFYIITDCPTREKNGWTGDASISAEHFMLHYAAENLLSDWLYCIKIAQKETGALPVYVPSDGKFRHFLVWDSALYSLPYQIYKHTGETKLIAETADAMMKNLRLHMSLLDERGVLEVGYGDWLPVASGADAYASPVGFCVSCMFLLCLKMTETMFNAIGSTDHIEFIQQSYAKVRKAIRDEYNENGIITKGKTESYHKPTYRICQTSQALGLYCGVFDEDEKQKAVETLVDLIVEKDNSFDCGFLGLRAIFHILSEYGYSDLAYEMITKPTFPSYGNMILRGETSVWERFPQGINPGSHNHHFMSDVSAWYIKTVAGINVNPHCDDPDRIVINPHFIKALESAKGSYENKNGSVAVSWARKDGKINVDINVSGGLDVVLGDNLNIDECVVMFKKK